MILCAELVANERFTQTSAIIIWIDCAELLPLFAYLKLESLKSCCRIGQQHNQQQLKQL